jgi:membrane fusion protein, multidrug efflux system
MCRARRRRSAACADTTSTARSVRYTLFALVAAILAIGGIWCYLSDGRHLSTTDAYVRSNEPTVSTDVSGIVNRIYVPEDQHVNRGQILFRLDADKFRIALDNARANLAQTALTLQSL